MLFPGTATTARLADRGAQHPLNPIPHRQLRRHNEVLGCERHDGRAVPGAATRSADARRRKVDVPPSDTLPRLPREALHTRARDHGGQLRDPPEESAAQGEGRCEGSRFKQLTGCGIRGTELMIVLMRRGLKDYISG